MVEGCSACLAAMCEVGGEWVGPPNHGNVFGHIRDTRLGMQLHAEQDRKRVPSLPKTDWIDIATSESEWKKRGWVQ